MHVQGSALSWVQDSLNLAYVDVNDVVLKRLSSKASNDMLGRYVNCMYSCVGG